MRIPTSILLGLIVLCPSITMAQLDDFPPQWTGGVGLGEVRPTDSGFVLLWNEAIEVEDPDTNAVSPPVRYNLYIKLGVGLTCTPTYRQRISFESTPSVQAYGFDNMYRVQGLTFYDLYQMALRAEDAAFNEDNNCNSYIGRVFDHNTPITTRHFPDKWATDVKTNTNISFHLQDIEMGVDLCSVFMTVNGQDVTYAIKGDKWDYQLTYVYQRGVSVPLPENSAITVRVYAEDLSSLDGNPINETWRFTTGQDNQPPFLTNHDPAPGEYGVDVEKHIKYTVNDDRTGVDQSTIRMSVEGTQITKNLLINWAANPNAMPVEFNFTAQFLPEQWITVQVDADDHAVVPNHMTEVYSFRTESDTIPPYTYGFYPGKNSTTAPLNTSVALRVADNLGVDSSSLNMLVDGVLIIRNGQVVVAPQAVDMVGTQFDYYIRYSPPDTFPTGAPIVVEFEAQDIADVPNPLPREVYSFYVSGVLDSNVPFVSDRVPDKDSLVVIPRAIKFHVQDLDAGVDLSTLKVNVNDSNFIINGRDVAGFQMVRITGTQTDLQISITPFFTFVNNQVVPIRIEASDLASPPNAMPTEFYQFTVQIDREKPYARNYNPIKNQADVARNSNVYLELFDDGSGIDPTSIMMGIDGIPVSPELHRMFNDGLAVVYEPTTDFDDGQMVTVTVIATDVKPPRPNPQESNSFIDNYTFTVGPDFDNDPPSSTITSLTNGMAVNDQNMAISGTASDAFSGVQFTEITTTNFTDWRRVDGHNNWYYQWFLGPDGYYTIKSQATDNCGNLETPGPGKWIIVDRYPPNCVFVTPQDNEVISNPSMNIEVDPTDTVSGYTTTSGVDHVVVNAPDANGVYVDIYITDAPWIAITDTPKTDGIYELRATAYDVAENRQHLPAAIDVMVDSTAPVSHFVTPQDGAIVSGITFDLVVDANDNLSGVDSVQVRSNEQGNSSWKTATFNSGQDVWEYTWTLPADGMYSLYSRAIDVGNNTEIPSNPIVVQVANSLPYSEITDPSPGDVLTVDEYLVKGTAGDNNLPLDKVELDIDPGPGWQEVNGLEDWNFIWSIGGDGLYTLVSKATNDIGNEEVPSRKVHVWVDRQEPNTRIDLPAQGAGIKGNILTVEGTATDPTPGSGVTDIRLDLGNVSMTIAVSQPSSSVNWFYDWNLVADPLDNGLYQLLATAIDKGGLEDPTPAGRTIFIDRNEPPVSSVTSHSTGDCISGSVTVSGTATDITSGVDEVQVSFDNGNTWSDATVTTSGDNNVTWTYNWDTTQLGDGSKRIISRATDMAGNVQDAPSGPLVTIDNSDPTITLTSHSDGDILKREPIYLGGDVSNTGCEMDSVEVDIEGQTHTADLNMNTMLWTYRWRPPATGDYTISAIATDNAGNSGSTTPISVFIDGGKPTVTITNPRDGEVLAADQVLITGTAEDAETAITFIAVSTDNGVHWESVTPIANPWSYTWDVPADGTYTLVAKAVDSVDNREASSPVVMTVNRSKVKVELAGYWDTSITSTSDGKLDIWAIILDEANLDKVEIYYQGAPTGIELNRVAEFAYALGVIDIPANSVPPMKLVLEVVSQNQYGREFFWPYLNVE